MFAKMEFHPEFNIELELNLSGKSNPKQLVRYNLASVIFHHGKNINSGHYTCKLIFLQNIFFL
jgi:uncharacterized UBP type Zn finger protein